VIAYEAHTLSIGIFRIHAKHDGTKEGCMESVLENATHLFGALWEPLFGARAGQRWLFRPNRGWLGGNRITDRCVLWICFGFIVMGTTLVVRDGQHSVYKVSSPRWPTVEGTIVSMRVRERQSAWGTEWVPDINYHYVVGGRHYQNTHLTASRDVHWKSRAELNDFLSRYVARDTVRVYYNPGDASEAMLEPGSGGLDTAALGGILLIILGLSTLMIYDRMH
jgi:hypothetical protein